METLEPYLGPRWRHFLVAIYQVFRPLRIIKASLEIKLLIGLAVVAAVAMPWYLTVGAMTRGVWFTGIPVGSKHQVDLRSEGWTQWFSILPTVSVDFHSSGLLPLVGIPSRRRIPSVGTPELRSALARKRSTARVLGLEPGLFSIPSIAREFYIAVAHLSRCRVDSVAIFHRLETRKGRFECLFVQTVLSRNVDRRNRCRSGIDPDRLPLFPCGTMGRRFRLCASHRRVRGR